MRIVPAFVGARGIDSVQFSTSGTLAQAKALKASGIDYVVGYLGLVTATIVKHVLEAGMAFMPCTFANRFSGVEGSKQYLALGIPRGATCWLDVENAGLDAPTLSAKIVGWDAAGKSTWQSGLYVGSPQPLTSQQLYALPVVRYWNALSREVDAQNQLAEPQCGWCQWQMNDSVSWAGIWSDVNIIGRDFKGRLPMWVVA